MTTTTTHVLTALKEIHNVHKQTIDNDNVDLAQIAIEYHYLVLDSITIDGDNCTVENDLTEIMNEFRQKVNEQTSNI